MEAKDISPVGKKIMAMLRKAAQQKPKYSAHPNPLNNLSDRQLAEIYFRFNKGQSVEEVRRVIHLDWRVLKEIKLPNLREYLRRFEKAILSPIREILAKVPGSERKKINEKVKTVLDELDCIGTLRWLIQEQVSRLQAYRAYETSSGAPAKGTNVVVQDLGVLLEKCIRLEIELGILEPKESKVDSILKERFLHILDQKVQNSGKNLLTATSKFLEQIDEEAIDIDVNKEGDLEEIEISG